MDLADLLAREGYAEPAISDLLSWARGRAGVLIAELDDDSPLRPLLTGTQGHVPVNMSQVSGTTPPVMVLRRAAAAPRGSAVEEKETGHGGFTRFGEKNRMNRAPLREQEEPAGERPTLVRSFALAAEKAAEKAVEKAVEKAAEKAAEKAVEVEESRPVVKQQVVQAAVQAKAKAQVVVQPTGELSGVLPQAALGFSAEESGGLVVGIPEEDVSDVPIPRKISNSGAHRRPTSAAISGALVDDDDEVPVQGRGAATKVAPEPLKGAGMPVPKAVEPSKPVPAAQESGPVLRSRSAKKKVVELSAPVGRAPIASKATAVVMPRGGPPRRLPPPPPPPGGRRTPGPVVVDEEIQELSRVEMIDDLPAYLRDDEE